MRTKRVAFIGGGLFSIASATFLAENKSVEVWLGERSWRLGGGSTGKNHGRLHCGATGVDTDPPEVTERKLQGSRYMRTLPGIWDSSAPGVYWCGKGTDSDEFRAKCLSRHIDVSELARWRQQSRWLLEGATAGHAMSVPEFSLNPARLTGRLAHIARERGANIVTRCETREVKRTAGGLAVRNGKGDTFTFDFVVNAASKYVNSVLFEDRPPLLDLEYYRWPVMAIPAAAMPRLDHVLVVVDKAKMFPSMIPHGEWVTFDVKSEPERVGGPDDYPAVNPRPVDGSDAKEQEIVRRVRAAFRPLAELPRDEFMKRTVVFYGVHGRRSGELATSDIAVSRTYDDVDNYLVRHGGLMTSSLLDALETVEAVEGCLGIKSPPREQRLLRLARDLVRRWPGLGMIFQQEDE